MSCRVIAICNQKGGVGKTTTCVNLSAALSALEQRVLMVDMDPQANATFGIGITDTLEGDVYDLLEIDSESIRREDVRSLIRTTMLEFLEVLPASQSLAGMEVKLVTKPDREQRLKNAIATIRDDYDFVFIDSPPSLNLLTLNVLTSADSVLIPIQCEYYALQGLAELLNTIKLVQQNLNEELGIEGALLTMFDSRLNLSRQVAEDVQSTFSEKVFKTVIPRNVKLSEAPSFGKPIILYDILSQGAAKYMELAKEILK